ncbi:MAG: YbhB/YbcL family Raf kinase inhibitor-like protein [Gemmatimonadales bacterium]|jgi:Raf kinase inhibitor-like YbhB/YbcL family protein
MRLTSSAFEDGHPIPVRHTADGADVSPPLAWTEVPAETVELALVVDDPDAPRAEPWVHWLLYGIPATWRSLEEGLPRIERPDGPDGIRQGRNSFASDDIGYRGPAPPRGHGTHHYRFRLHALDHPLDMPPGVDRSRLEAALDGHVLATAELTGTYER